ncbi:histamine N-methyltransferase-like isoform X2 [Ptychodera flava]|uniref:histamine N-methyltransferase-like isoform X2 n=1 Tax=Ptychodera flava TaxID=63121 RepID=UPI00396A8E64
MASSLESIYSDIEYYFYTYELYGQRMTTASDEQWKAEWESIIKGLSERAVVQPEDDVGMLAVAAGQGACGMLFTKYREWEGNPMNLLTAHDITSYMKRKGLNYQIYLREGAVDVAEVFDDKSAEGNMILDFLVQRKDFRKNARKELLKTVLDFVMEHSHEEKGKRFMSDDEIEIVVIKSA